MIQELMLPDGEGHLENKDGALVLPETEPEENKRLCCGSWFSSSIVEFEPRNVGSGGRNYIHITSHSQSYISILVSFFEAMRKFYIVFDILTYLFLP